MLKQRSMVEPSICKRGAGVFSESACDQTLVSLRSDLQHDYAISPYSTIVNQLCTLDLLTHSSTRRIIQCNGVYSNLPGLFWPELKQIQVPSKVGGTRARFVRRCHQPAPRSFEFRRPVCAPIPPCSQFTSCLQRLIFLGENDGGPSCQQNYSDVFQSGRRPRVLQRSYQSSGVYNTIPRTVLEVVGAGKREGELDFRFVGQRDGDDLIQHCEEILDGL